MKRTFTPPAEFDGYGFGSPHGVPELAKPQLPGDDDDVYRVSVRHGPPADFPRGGKAKPARPPYDWSTEFDLAGADPGTGLTRRGKIVWGRLFEHLGLI